MSIFSRHKTTLPSAEEALPGRATSEFVIASKHRVLDAPVVTPTAPEGYEVAIFGLGCFWGAEEIYWQKPGVWSTSVGYAGGTTPNPSYEEVCSGRTGHTEAVLVAYDPSVISTAQVLQKFWEGHDPTQGMRQGNDAGTQYRSAIYWRTPEQRDAAIATRDAYAAALAERGMGPITTEIAEAGAYYPAEDYHQQYLHKNPMGYCGIGGTGVSCPIGTGATAA